MANSVFVTIKDTGPLKLKPRHDFRFDVGILPEEGRERHQGTDLTIGEIGLIHEFGSSAANIPARSWLRRWLAGAGEKFQQQIVTEVARMVRTQKFQYTGTLQRIVSGAARSVRARIEGGHIGPANAPSTLKRKAPERRPLIESKQFLRAIRARLSTGFGVKLRSK